MPDGGYSDLSVRGIEELYRRGGARPSDVVGSCLDAIEAKDGIVGAFVEVFREEALARARELDGEDSRGRPLFGVPVAVKDNICTRLMPTSCGSRILRGYRPPYDATAVSRLRAAGAVIVGKTNMDEFAMGSSTEHSSSHPTRNPWDTDCAPGGSSGGSAAAVAAGMVPLALGSDTGGSIRQPASFCGVTGIKGTWGRVSRYGLVAFASSLDQIGPIAADVDGCARALRAIAGADGIDSTALADPCPALEGGGEAALDGMRIGVPSSIKGIDLDPSVSAALAAAVRHAAEAGSRVAEVDLPDLGLTIACYYVIAAAEASSNLARYDGVRFGMRVGSDTLGEMYARTRSAGFGEEVKRRILLGTFVLSSGYHDQYYGRACEVRERIRDCYRRLFGSIDLLILPTAPGPAFRLGERLDDPVAMYLSDIFTTPASVAGLPAVSIPAGLSADGLPVGLQLIAAGGREDLIVRGASALERAFAFRRRCVPGGSGGGGRS
ncbi:MAG: Asp-tRNA(Asn)/Glu-tRNA(Gln) amidotransferase subunit GatA [Candidatus Krumholzibacteria bacterium]|nr:Asp-tRNA(Asn)/Glu-tRNA(Gln) amidotransferase subunit GatA [Candidatus Krumholzibacteria bacterium]